MRYWRTFFLTTLWATAMLIGLLIVAAPLGAAVRTDNAAWLLLWIPMLGALAVIYQWANER